MMYTNTHTQSGFSLVETLVAITILLIVITGPLTLVSNSARSTNFANDQVIAFFLAQEGLELAQAARDDLLLEAFNNPGAPNAAWDEFADDSNSGPYRFCFDSNGCGLDQDTDAAGSLNVYNCGSGAIDCRLNQVTTTGAQPRSTYTYIAGANSTPAKYTRVIEMTETTSGSQVQVVSRVTWQSDGQRAQQEVEAVTYLFNVYGR